MRKRKVIRDGFVESQWKPFFDHVDSSRLRRGKASVKQGISVAEWSVRDGMIQAVVKGHTFRAETWQVRIPTVDWWAPYTDEAAKWFSRRPDWFAALLANVWEPDFLEFVSAAGLRLFPDEATAERLAKESLCSCSDWVKPCQHIAAVVYFMIRNMESTPLFAFECVGIDRSTLLNQVHLQSVQDAQIHPSITQPPQSGEPMHSWQEETEVLTEPDEPVETLKHRIHPQLDPHKLEMWKKHYLKWEWE